MGEATPTCATSRDSAPRLPPDAGDVSRAYVRARLAALETIISDRLERGHPDRVTDPLRGLRITAQQLRNELVHPPEVASPTAPDPGRDFARRVVAALDDVPADEQPQLHRTARRLGLDDIDVDLLVIAAAPD